MPRKHFRRFLPDGDTVRDHKYLAWLGTWLHHPNLWHLNRDSVAGGFAIGLFAGLVPGPLQMLAAVLLAVPLKKNLPVALATTFYTNPFTIAPLYLLAYGYGRFLLGTDHHLAAVQPFEWDWAHWIDSLQALAEWTYALGKPLAVGSNVEVEVGPDCWNSLRGPDSRGAGDKGIALDFVIDGHQAEVFGSIEEFAAVGGPEGHSGTAFGNLPFASARFGSAAGGGPDVYFGGPEFRRRIGEPASVGREGGMNIDVGGCMERLRFAGLWNAAIPLDGNGPNVIVSLRGDQ